MERPSSSPEAPSFVQLGTTFTWLRERRSRDSHERKDQNWSGRPKLQNRDFDEELRHLRTLGNYFGAFYHSTHDWLVRRVDTNEMVDSSVGDTATKTSVTIDGRAVARMRVDAHISPDDELFLPLPAAPKQLLGHFDARFDTKPVSVLSSIDNAHVAVGILLCRLVEYKVPVESIQPRLIDFLYGVASCKRTDPFYLQMRSALDGSDSEPPTSEAASCDRGSPADNVNTILNILTLVEEVNGELETLRFFQMLDDFLENFTAVGVLDAAPLHMEFVVKTYTVSARAEIIRDVKPTIVGGPIVRFPYRYFLVMVGTMIMIDLSMTFVVGVIFVVFAYLVDQTIILLRRGLREFNLSAGAFAYRTYMAATSRFTQLALSGCFRIRSSYTNLGLYGSQHYRLAIPEGARALAASIRIGDESAEIEGTEKQVIDNWVAAHFTNGNSNNTSTMTLSVLVLPKSQALLKQAFYAAMITACVLFAGLLSHFAGWLTTANGADNYGLAHLALRSSGSIVTIIMIAPSVYTIILLQQNEHRFVSRLLRTMRHVVGLSALICASVAVPIGLDLPTRIVVGWWIVGFVVAMFSCWHIAATRYYHGVLAQAIGDPE